MSEVLTLLRRHAVALAALFLVLGGSAYAAVGGVGGAAKPTRLYACVDDELNTLELAGAASTCPEGERKISWNAGGRPRCRRPDRPPRRPGTSPARLAGPAQRVPRGRLDPRARPDRPAAPDRLDPSDRRAPWGRRGPLATRAPQELGALRETRAPRGTQDPGTPDQRVPMPCPTSPSSSR